MKINPFQLAELLKPHDHQLDLVIGQEYLYDGERVKLERISFTPTFTVHKSWWGRQTFKPSYRLEAVLSTSSPNSIVAWHCFGVPLDQFVARLQPYYLFQNKLDTTVQALTRSNQK